MTTRVRRLELFLGALGCVSLALVLVVEAAAAPASSHSTRKRQDQLAVDLEFAIQPAAWLALRPVWLPPGAAEKPPVAPRLEAQTLVIENRAGTAPPPPARGRRGSTNIPKFLPPFTGPASPIR